MQAMVYRQQKVLDLNKFKHRYHTSKDDAVLIKINAAKATKADRELGNVNSVAQTLHIQTSSNHVGWIAPLHIQNLEQYQDRE
ncbi:hypothetical protein AM1_4481 [Acaryochloris marina MBIC11017]|uniref:Uncharacterized protein n=1 Tax=Acaryochloris marina (strain MBIC 11017) TaxID=329726 RepID=B0CG10_ACAM1|nr:hypothetical protein AM1_4481 [Acaryochloris marina MBIC11017]BDM78372.1 hypothetical protein AM10699_12420 [Acaryochloris marina MBIC10699]